VRLRRPTRLLGAVFGGLYGVGLVGCLLLLHLAELESFGLPYAAPLCEGRPGGLGRLLLRLPDRLRKRRDPLLRTPDRRRRSGKKRYYSFCSWRRCSAAAARSTPSGGRWSGCAWRRLWAWTRRRGACL
jgi:hypothetical protein